MKERIFNHPYLLKYEMEASDRGPFGGIPDRIKTHCASALDNSETLRKLARGMVAVGYVFIIGLFAVLALVWVLGGQLFRLGKHLARSTRQKREIGIEGMEI